MYSKTNSKIGILLLGLVLVSLFCLTLGLPLSVASQDSQNYVYNEFEVQSTQNIIGVVQPAPQLAPAAPVVPTVSNQFDVNAPVETVYVVPAPQVVTVAAPTVSNQFDVNAPVETVYVAPAPQVVSVAQSTVQNEFVFVPVQPTRIEYIEVPQVVTEFVYVEVPTQSTQTIQTAPVTQPIVLSTTTDIIDVVNPTPTSTSSPSSNDVFETHSETIIVQNPTQNPITVIPQADLRFSVNFIDKPLVVYSCQSYSETIVVRNDASESAQFSIGVRNPKISSWFGFNPQTFVLAAGEMRAINVSFTVPCATSMVTTYDLVVANSQYTQSYERSFTVLETTNVFFAVANNSIETCVNVPAVVPYVITNNGIVTEEYALSVSGFQNRHVTFTAPNLVLEPGQTYEGNITFDYANAGTKRFDLRVKTTQSKLTAKIPVTVKINTCVEYDVLYEDTKAVCSLGYGGIPLFIENKGTESNTYRISLPSNAKSYATLSDTKLTLLPGENKTITVSLDPDIVSEKVLQVTVKDSVLKTTKLATINVSSTFCYDVSVSSTFSDICPQPHVFVVNVTNNGLYSETVQLDSVSSHSLIAPQLTFILESGESRILTVPVDKGPISHTGEIVASIANTFTVYTPQHCYGLEFVPTYIPISYYSEVHNVTLTNVGIANSTYDLTLVGQDWMYLQNSSVYIPSGESRIVQIATMAHGVRNTSYAAELSADNLYYVQSEQIEFDVNPSNDSIMMLLILLGLIVAGIIFVLLFPSLAVLLLLGLLVFGLWFVYPYIAPFVMTGADADSNSTQTVVDTELQFKLNMVQEFLKQNRDEIIYFVPINGTRTLSLGGMFYDPDYDNLTYSYTGNFSQITVTVVPAEDGSNDEHIVVTPAPNFVGYESFYVTASDGQVSTTSPRLYIVVTSEEMIAQYSRRILTQTVIALSVILLILLVVFLVLDARAAKRAQAEKDAKALQKAKEKAKVAKASTAPQNAKKVASKRR
jgi:energy-coupling factor transporter transmembrane protein EcfT